MKRKYNVCFYSKGDSGNGSITDTVATKKEAMAILKELHTHAKQTSRHNGVSKIVNGRFDCYHWGYAYWIEKA